VQLFWRLRPGRCHFGGTLVGDDLLEALNTISGKRRDAILTDAVDPQSAVCRLHVDLEFPKQFHVPVEHLSDVRDGEDV
jgi:hypothetical protein